jgi:hypothetical protein
MTSVQTMVRTVRTAAGLRDALFEELDNLRSGRSTPRQSTAVARVAAEIIKSVHMEIEFHSVMRNLQGKADKIGPLEAGKLELGAAAE